MVFKIENSEIVINGKSVFKALVGTYIIGKICKFLLGVEKRYHVTVETKTEKVKKEQKTSEKKSKVESN